MSLVPAVNLSHTFNGDMAATARVNAGELDSALTTLAGAHNAAKNVLDAVVGSDNRLVASSVGLSQLDATVRELFSEMSGSVYGATAKLAVATAATTNVAALSGLQTVNGYALASGDRVLLTAQTTPAQNGIWVAGTGAWNRTVDLAAGTAVGNGWYLVVANGGAAGTAYVSASPGTAIVGTSPLQFVSTGTLGVTSVGVTSSDLAVTGSPVTGAGNIDLTIAPGAVTNSKLANAPATTVKANMTGAPAAPTDVPLATFRAALGSGTPDATKYLRGDGVWDVPAQAYTNVAMSFTGGVGQIVGVLTGSRSYTFPDASGSVPLLENNQTWSGNNTFNGSVTIAGPLTASGVRPTLAVTTSQVLPADCNVFPAAANLQLTLPAAASSAGKTVSIFPGQRCLVTVPAGELISLNIASPTITTTAIGFTITMATALQAASHAFVWGPTAADVRTINIDGSAVVANTLTAPAATITQGWAVSASVAYALLSNGNLIKWVGGTIYTLATAVATAAARVLRVSTDGTRVYLRLDGATQIRVLTFNAAADTVPATDATYSPAGLTNIEFSNSHNITSVPVDNRDLVIFTATYLGNTVVAGMTSAGVVTVSQRIGSLLAVYSTRLVAGSLGLLDYAANVGPVALAFGNIGAASYSPRGLTLTHVRQGASAAMSLIRQTGAAKTFYGLANPSSLIDLAPTYYIRFSGSDIQLYTFAAAPARSFMCGVSEITTFASDGEGWRVLGDAGVDERLSSSV